MTVGRRLLYGSKYLWVSQSKRFDVRRRKMDVSLEMLVGELQGLGGGVAGTYRRLS
jgi:hypothetical protein